MRGNVRSLSRMLVGISALMGAASAQNRLESPIDWDAAERARQAVRITTIDALRARVPNSVQLDRIRLPVLLPEPRLISAAPRLRHQETSFTAAFALKGAKLTIAGSGTAIVSPASGAPPFVSIDDAFERTEDGADLSISRFGASYVLRISCAAPADSRCTKSDFLRSVAASLVPIGGKKQ